MEPTQACHPCPALLVPKPRGDSLITRGGTITPGGVASQSRIPLGSRKQGSWVGVAPGALRFTAALYL